jgi:hypothetical protein
LIPVTIAAVLLYRRPAGGNGVLKLRSVLLLIAGGSVDEGWARLWSLFSTTASGRGRPAQRCSFAALHNVVIGPTQGGAKRTYNYKLCKSRAEAYL